MIPFTEYRAWESDKTFKFKQPDLSYNDKKFTTNFVKPPCNSISYMYFWFTLHIYKHVTSFKDWPKMTWESFIARGGVTGDSFILWMRTPAFQGVQNPFRNFQGRVSTCPERFMGLCKGTYKLKITFRESDQ